MFFSILLGFFTALFAIAFALLHLLASISELKKGITLLEINFSSLEVALRLYRSFSTSSCRLSHYFFG